MKTVEYRVAWADKDWGLKTIGKTVYEMGIDGRYMVTKAVGGRINRLQMGQHINFRAWDIDAAEEVVVTAVIRSRYA